MIVDGSEKQAVYDSQTKFKDINKPRCEMSGKDFRGWYYDKACQSKVPDDTIITGDMKVYCGYGDANYVITFNENGGSIYSGSRTETVYAENVKFKNLNKPSCYGSDSTQVFEGWYLEAACINRVPDDTIISKNMEVFAKYVSTTEITDYSYYSIDSSTGHRLVYYADTIENNDSTQEVVALDIDSSSISFKKWARTRFNEPFIIGSKKQSIREDFLSGCTGFNQPLSIPDSVETIGVDFMFDCHQFNSVLTLNTKDLSIDEEFMNNCINFHQQLTVPSSVQFIGAKFMENCPKFVDLVVNNLASNWQESDETLSVWDSQDPAYVSGIFISGDKASDFVSRFPNISGGSEPTFPIFRKLVVS